MFTNLAIVWGPHIVGLSENKVPQNPMTNHHFPVKGHLNTKYTLYSIAHFQTHPHIHDI